MNCFNLMDGEMYKVKMEHETKKIVKSISNVIPKSMTKSTLNDNIMEEKDIEIKNNIGKNRWQSVLKKYFDTI